MEPEYAEVKAAEESVLFGNDCGFSFMQIEGDKTWKDCRKEWKQKKDVMTMQELVKYIQVEKNSRNLDGLELEDNKSSKALLVDQNSPSGSKRKLDGQVSASTNQQDKPKRACWKCGETGHFKKN
ncbi:hypothetical protein RJ639_039182, partial [Escallonia herrerae]